MLDFCYTTKKIFFVVVCTNNSNYPRKVEMTESGKFIEIERDNPDNDCAIDKIDEENEVGINNDDNKTVTDKERMPVTSSPNQSPGKTVRIKENGTQPNGDKVGEVRLLYDYLVILIDELLNALFERICIV